MASGEMKKPRRRLPRQARSRHTVECILEAAARVFRREGWDATTNRIAEEAGVGIGSLYEYFPDKQSLLLELAVRHVELAERGVDQALSSQRPARELLAALQGAIRESQRFPSQALDLVDAGAAGEDLRNRARSLRDRVLGALAAVARREGLSEPELRAKAAFGAIGALTVRAMFEDPGQSDALARHLVAMAAQYLEGKTTHFESGE